MRVWTYANIVGTAGTWMQLVAQNLFVLQLTDSTAATGLSLAAQAAPALLLGVRGGALVDRLPLAVTAAVGQVLLAAVAFGTAALAAFGLLSVPVLITLGAVGGLVATVEGPACALFGNELVTREDVPSAIAVGAVVGNLGRLLGTAAAGTAIAWFGIPGAYVANGISFVLVALVIPFLRPAGSGDAPRAETARDDVRPLRLLLGEPVLLGLVAVTLVACLLGRNYSLSLAALVTGPMALDAAAYGRIAVALAVGGILGALVAGSARHPGLRLVVVLTATGGAVQMLAGAAPGLGVLVAAAALLAATEAAAGTLTASLVQTVPPAHLRGRALGAWRTVSTGWGLGGPPALGLLLELGGVRGGLALGGALTVLLLGGGWLVVGRRGALRSDSPATPAAP